MTETLIILAELFGWYLVVLLILVRKHGLDPSLLTYASPFCLFNNALVIALNVLLIPAIALSPSAAHLIIGSAFALSLVQVSLLVLFERAPTQPVEAYALIIAETFLLMLLTGHKKWQLMVIATVALIALIAIIAIWSRVSVKRYNKWVERKAMRIHRLYYDQGASVTNAQWFIVLHFAVTESIARPKIVRLIESGYFYLRRPERISSGIMQVGSNRLLSDKESIALGSQIIVKALNSAPNFKTKEAQYSYLAKVYNGSKNEKANRDYVGYLFSTHAGLEQAWHKIKLTPRRS